MGKSLKLVNKDKKKDFFIDTPYKQKKSKAPKTTPKPIPKDSKKAQTSNSPCNS